MLLACRLNLSLLLLLLLVGCAVDGARPVVEERTATPSRRIERHTVSPGDTLFSIAWSYGIDFKQLAATNDLVAPYPLRPGQQLKLPRPGAGPKIVDRAAPNAVAAGRQAAITGGGRPVSGSAQPAPNKALRPAAGDKNKVGPSAWRWPAQGVVAEGYRVHSPVHKGIDIRGELGEPVYAANDGKVV